MKIKLSDAQRELLIYVVEREEKGANPVRVKGRGRQMTADVLRRHNLVSGTLELRPQIDGKKLVESWKCGRCGHLDYHCLASGCNHVDPVTSTYCDCEEFVQKVG